MIRHRMMWPVIALMAILMFNAAFTPGFLEVSLRDGRLYGSLIDILNRAAPTTLLALGMTLVIATGGVDLSVGAVMAISGSVAASMIAGAQAPGTATVVLIALAGAAICGVLNGFLVGVLAIQPIVATLLIMIAGRGVAQLVTGGQVLVFDNAAFAAIGSGASFGLPNPVWICAGALLSLGVLCRKTALGLFVEAVGGNAKASRLVGINERSLKLAVYTLCALAAGVAGLIAAADIRGADANNAGLYLELDAIIAVCFGGTSMAGGRFSLAGSAVSAVLMQALTTTMLTRGVSPEATLVLKAVVVILVCLLQSPVWAARRATG